MTGTWLDRAGQALERRVTLQNNIAFKAIVQEWEEFMSYRLD